MSIAILRGDAAHVPLADGSVDLVVSSPPYHSLRDYQDGGESLAGQVGLEATPQAYIDALLECTRDWIRVLKPSGSIFVVLGDSYANDTKWGGATSGKHVAGLHGKTGIGRARRLTGIPAKSLMDAPARYAIRCVDELGLIKRAEIVWSKANSMPEPVKDRVRRSHEMIYHFTKEPVYFSAVDEIREPHVRPWNPERNGGRGGWDRGDHFNAGMSRAGAHPLGKLPGSVWEISNQPLNVPEHIEHARCCGGRMRPGCADGLDHHAAYPCDLIRPIIRGWSPAAICSACGDGRFPVIDKPGLLGGDNNPESRNGMRRFSTMDGGQKNWERRISQPDRLLGYACSCTPYSDHPERRKPTVTPSRHLGRGHQDNDVRASAIGTRHHGNDWPERLPVRDYHLEGWEPPPSRPAVVLDPFAGTGTTLLVADVLGRHAVGVELSADYCGLARWRTTDPGERARAMQVPRPPVVPVGQPSLFDEAAS